MSRMTDAFSSLLASHARAIGGAQVVTIGATANIPAIVEEVPRDLVFVDGGTGERQSFRLQVKASELGNVEPPKYTAVSFTPVGSNTAVALKVLEVSSNNGVFIISIGDPNTNL